MNVSEAIRTKRAIRKFQQIPIKDDDVRVILNSGRRAQSSKNTQPWRFIAITDKSVLKALSGCGRWADLCRFCAEADWKPDTYKLYGQGYCCTDGI